MGREMHFPTNNPMIPDQQPDAPTGAPTLPPRPLRFLCSVALLLLLCFVSAGNGWAARVVRVGVYENRPMLFMGEGGVARGVYVDVLAAIAQAEGWTYQFVPGSWSENLDRLAAAEIDVMPDIGYSAERAKRFDFSRESIFSTWAQIYVPRDSDLQSYEGLEGKSIAVLRNDVHFPPLQTMLETFGLHVKYQIFDDYEAVLEAVSEKKADAALLSRIAGMVNERRFKIKRSPMILDPIRVHFAFPKDKNADLREAIDRHLEAMKQSPDSALNRALARWLPDTRTNWFPWWAVWALVGGGGALIMALLIAVLLRMQVRRKTAQLAGHTTRLETEIVERRRAEVALRESEERYRAVFQTALDPLVVLDAHGNILAWNQQAERTFGYTPDEIIGRNFDTLFKKAEGGTFNTSTWNRLAAVDGGITAQRLEIIAVRRDGTTLPVELAVSPAHLESRHIVTVFVRDLTERQAALEARTRLLAMDSELSVARQIQDAILPRADGRFCGREEFDVHAEMIPAKEVGGDFYDYFLIDDDLLGILVGDVSGKGVPAAILMAASRAMLRSAAMSGIGPADVLRHVNNLLEESTAPSMFVSAFYGIIDLRSGLIEYCNGGHDEPVVIHADGTHERLTGSANIALGAVPNQDFTAAALRLTHGDTVLLFTDGVTEAMNSRREMFTEDGLLNFVATAKTSTPAETVHGVLAAIHNFTEGAAQSDDITLLAVRYR